MRLIQLSDKYFTKVDDDDYEKYGSLNLKLYLNKKSLHCPRAVLYIRKDGTTSSQFLSRLILNAPKGTVVDHINRDTLDNRKENLRVTNYSNNVRNSRIYSTNKSGYRGVSWDKFYNKWRAQITVNRKNIVLGFFTKPKLAYMKYKEYVDHNFGHFFPSI